MIDIVLVAGLYMIVLHRPDGAEFTVSPSHITSMHAKAPSAEKNKLVTTEARCVVWLDDGKIIAVMETCDRVKTLMDEAVHK